MKTLCRPRPQPRRPSGAVGTDQIIFTCCWLFSGKRQVIWLHFWWLDRHSDYNKKALWRWMDLPKHDSWTWDVSSQTFDRQISDPLQRCQCPPINHCLRKCFGQNLWRNICQVVVRKVHLSQLNILQTSNCFKQCHCLLVCEPNLDRNPVDKAGRDQVLHNWANTGFWKDFKRASRWWINLLNDDFLNLR